MSGVDQLKEQLEDMGEALRAFDDPLVNQVPGLRLMHQSLRERESHIREQIDKVETCSLNLTLAGAAVQDQGVDADGVAALLTALGAGVRAAALDHVSTWSIVPAAAIVTEAVALHLAELTLKDGNADLLVTRRPGPLDAQLTDPGSGSPVVEHALSTVVHGLGGTEVPDDVAAAIRPIAAWVAEGQRTLTVTLTPAALKPADVTVDRATAQQLLETLPG